MNSKPPWEEPRIKMILQIFKGSMIASIKNITNVVREVGKDDEIHR